MGIAVPSQLRKATQQWNPSPPLPLLPPPPLPPRLAMASASTTPTPLPASSSRSEAPPPQTPQPLSRLPPLTTWQPRLSTADMADMADMADTDTVVMEATESALLRLGSLITSLKFPSAVVFAQPWVIKPLHPELSFHASPPSSKPSLLLTSKRASARLRLSLGTDGGDTVEPPLPEELLLSDRTLSLPTTLQSRRVPPGARTGVWSKGRPTLRPMPTMAMVDTDLAMEATAMVVLVMATARGLLTLKPMPITAMAVLATAMARGLLMPSPTMAMVEPTLATAMAVTVLVSAIATASKGQSCSRELQPLKLTLEEQIDPSKKSRNHTDYCDKLAYE